MKQSNQKEAEQEDNYGLNLKQIVSEAVQHVRFQSQVVPQNSQNIIINASKSQGKEDLSFYYSEYSTSSSNSDNEAPEPDPTLTYKEKKKHDTIL